MDATGRVAHRLVLPDGAERRVTIRAPLAAQLASAGYQASARHSSGDLAPPLGPHRQCQRVCGRRLVSPPIERETMFAEKPVGSVRPETYARLRTSKTVAVTAAEHDVFGDGTVILKQATGTRRATRCFT